jgi:molybdopterin molybdotransferase
MPEERVLNFSDARACVEQHAREIPPPASETVELLAAQGRVLAEDIATDREYPPFPRATRDGYAARASDLTVPGARLRLAGAIKAGMSFAGELQPGTCVEIMTGAPVPRGADANVMLEYTRAHGDGTVEFTRAAVAGENIVPQGSEAAAGRTVLGRGTRMSHAQIAVAAAVGRPQVRVFRQPHIAILPTGDEIVDIDQVPGPAHIRNSNSYSLAAQVAAAGGLPRQLPVAPDRHQDLRDCITAGLDSDLLLLGGGVSMGKYDLVEEILRDFDAELLFTGALIQPGKPIVFGRVPAGGGGAHRYFFGLPGNPLSTMVTFDLFARAFVDALSGAPPEALKFAQAQLTDDFHTRPGLTRFLPAILTGDAALPRVERIAWQGSGDIFSAARANCYLVVPPDRESLRSGEAVSVWIR